MRDGKRVFGADGNPITGLVKRHADHKNSGERLRGDLARYIEHVQLAEGDDGTEEGKRERVEERTTGLFIC